MAKKNKSSRKKKVSNKAKRAQVLELENESSDDSSSDVSSEELPEDYARANDYTVDTKKDEDKQIDPTDFNAKNQSMLKKELTTEDLGEVRLVVIFPWICFYVCVCDRCTLVMDPMFAFCRHGTIQFCVVANYVWQTQSRYPNLPFAVCLMGAKPDMFCVPGIFLRMLHVRAGSERGTRNTIRCQLCVLLLLSTLPTS
mgnify:FL=1